MNFFQFHLKKTAGSKKDMNHFFISNSSKVYKNISGERAHHGRTSIFCSLNQSLTECVVCAEVPSC
ncbi:hypothetical protein BpHYR1_011528 [Brachionus plicatilis]|uniref:Uncharacterized protein n=1 Tax=Brachionus plicatilis TaxID=10195 RepID=A0A3M7QZ29_BRAPC|nr:hypothetical protein BpHYR1_011528 [Brachionus plicatilis]